MNTEIVRILEREFPYQPPIEESASQLVAMMASMKSGVTSDANIAALMVQFENTIEGIVSGRIAGVDPRTRDAVQQAWHDFQTQQSESDIDQYRAHLDEEEELTLSRIGRSEKYPIPRGERKRLGNLTDEEFEIYAMAYEAGKKAGKQGDDTNDPIPF